MPDQKPLQKQSQVDQWFLNLYSRYRKPILSWVKKAGLETAAAEDLTHDIFLKAFRTIRKVPDLLVLEPLRSERAWLWTIARNALIDWKRKNHRHSDGESVGIEWESIPCPRSSPEKRAMKRMEGRHLRQAIKLLNRNQRRAFLLWLVRGLDPLQISEQLGMSLAAVKSLIFRARGTLRDSLQMAEVF